MSRRPYVVRQGDYTGLLAARFGVDADTLWGDPANRALAERRPDRDVLAPGDILHVPERPAASRPVQVHTTNRYRARVPTTTLSVLLRHDQRPLASERCLVHGAGRAPLERVTDGEGRLQLELPVHVREVTVLVVDRNLSCPVRIGHLDPPTQTSGARQRLAQLGYLARLGVQAGHEASGALVRSALRLFQRDQGVAPTGELDASTADLLRSAHGS